MRVIREMLSDIESKTFDIGFVGEKNHTCVMINCVSLFKQYPDAVATMVARPPVGDIYPVVLHRDGVFVVWNVSESDIANAGSGQYQLTFTDGEGDNAEIIKTVYGSFFVKPSMVSNGEAPDPIEDWLEEANEALAEFGKINELSASATTLAAGSEATAEITTVSGHKNIAIGIPKGDKGDKGDDGDPAPAEEVTAAVDAYLAENFSNPSNPPLDRSLSSSSSAAPADLVGNLKSALSDYSNYIGTISVMDGYGVSEYYQKIVASSGSKCVYFAVQPNALYRINKTVITSRFVVGATESTPTSNVATTKIVRNDSATSIEFLTGASDQYICVMVYSSSDSMSWSSVLESISVQINSANDRNARARIGIAENKLDDLITVITPIITNGYFVSNTGSYSPNSSFMVTEPFKVYRNTKLFVYARGYNTNVAIISRVDVNKIKYVPKVICPDGTARTYELVVTESGYYAISGNKDTTFVIYAVPYSANDTQINLAMFQKFGVVGDSYASGVIFSDNSTSYTKYECSWGQIIARDCGTQCTNYSEGGLSTRTWLTDTDHGLPFLLNSDPEDIYYLALGINDYYLLGEDYLGTESDIGDDSKDTFYGNYSKIISAIMTHAPKAKLIMFTCSNTNEVPQMFNDAIIKIALHYSIPYIIQADDEYFQSREYTAMVGGHPTVVGYAGMAEAFKRLISDAVKDNYYYFWKMYAYGT